MELSLQLFNSDHLTLKGQENTVVAFYFFVFFVFFSTNPFELETRLKIKSIEYGHSHSKYDSFEKTKLKR